MANFPLAEAQIVSLFVQSVIYGIHFTTFLIAVWTLLRRSKGLRKPVNWTLMTLAIVLFVVGTADLAFNLYHVIVAFILYTGPGGPAAEFERISNWVTVIRSVWTFLQTLTADGALIYRCWVIYTHKQLVVIFPIIVWCADAACAIAELYYTATLDQNTNLANASKVQPFLIGFITLALADNIITTSLIVYRIWTIQRQSARYFSDSVRAASGSHMSLSSINRILIESALLYTTTVALVLIVNLAGSNAVYAVSDLVMEVAGIQFDLIIIRVGRGIAAEHVQTAMEATQLQFQLRKTTTTYREGLTTAETGTEVARSGYDGSKTDKMPSLTRLGSDL